MCSCDRSNRHSSSSEADTPTSSGTASTAIGYELAVGTSYFVRVRGSRIHYRLFNPNRGDLPGLLFVHGFWAHSHWWDHIAPYFVEQYRVAALDLGGMGESESRPGMTAGDFAAQILAVIEDAALRPATIVAHSFGGTPTAHAGHARPDAIRRSVIIDSRMFVPGLPDPNEEDLIHLKVGKKFYATAEEAISRYRLMPSAGDIDPHLLRHIASHGLRRETGGWTWKFDHTLDPQLTHDPDRLIPAGLTTPLDFIYGAQSDVVSRTTAILITSYLTSCGAPIAVPRAGHHIFLEQPIALVSALRSLFARTPESPI